MQRLFQRPGVATQHSQGSSSNFSSNPSFDRNDASEDDKGPGAALDRCRSDASPQPDSLSRVSRAGLAVPFTEIPAPSQLRDSGYVEMAFTHIPDHQTESLDQQQHQSSSLSSEHKFTVPFRGLLQLSRRASESREMLQQQPSWSPDVILSSSLESATSNVSTDSSNNSPSLGSGVGSNLSLLPSASPLGLGIDTFRSYSPVETQPLTMPEIEVNENLVPGPKTYFALALCSTILCCLPVGVLALISAQQVRRSLAERDWHRAFLSSRKAKTRSLLAILVGATMWTFVVVTLSVTLVLYLKP
jgi:hypothetical protein